MEILNNYKEWTCTRLLHDGLITQKNYLWMMALIALQPVLYPVILLVANYDFNNGILTETDPDVFWTAEKLLFIAFMIGCMKVVIWMSYESGILQHKSCNKDSCTSFILGALRLFWTFIAPLIPVFLLIIVTLNTIVTQISHIAGNG